MTERLNVWSAWYGGDPEQLSAIYGGSFGSNHPFFQNRPSQYQGGVVGSIARFFWGQPTPQGEKRAKLHVPIASDMAAASADLLFSEPPTLIVEDDATQARIDELIDDGMHAHLLEAAELCAALGGVYLRVCWDTEHDDKPWLAPVHADAGVPEWRYGKLSAVTFWRVIEEDDRKVVRHLERHESGAILHAVYSGDQDTLGRQVPLTDYPETAGLVGSLTDGQVIQTGIKQLTADYVPNMRPNRLWRNLPAAAHLGRSDYAAVELAMDALDETWTSWMRDIDLGRGRILVPDAYLRSNGPGKGADFDPDRRVYSTLNMLPGPDQSAQITVSQFDIRVEEHSRTASELISTIVRTAGYSPQTFGLGEGAAMTATEVVARERRSMITRDRKGRYWGPTLASAVEALLGIDSAVFGTKVTPQRPKVEFGDVVSADPQSVATTVELLARAQAVSVETKVRMVHPDWDDTAVAAEVQRIEDDTAIDVPDPGLFRGAADESDEDEPPAEE